MEETLGKRIAAHRKRMGLTQDRLAELLGVTAQAVSKWENDQSCPDITMLPKLAEVFSVTTDELLGLKAETVHTAEVVTEPEGEEPEGHHAAHGNFELEWNSGRKGSLALALWVLLTGGLLMACRLWTPYSVGIWDVLWPTGLMVFGLFGLYPDFSVFRLSCGLVGGYYLLYHLRVFSTPLAKAYLLPSCLVLFGLCLLIDALRKPKKARFHVTHGGKPLSASRKTHCDLAEEGFDCAVCFGEQSYPIHLPRLAGGKAEVSFGELTVDLRGCETFAPGCRIDLDCSFGSLELLIPRSCRVEPATSTAFASVEVKGSPDPVPTAVVSVDCDASFGEITLRYL